MFYIVYLKCIKSKIMSSDSNEYGKILIRIQELKKMVENNPPSFDGRNLYMKIELEKEISILEKKIKRS